jgi:hypothetical protein
MCFKDRIWFLLAIIIGVRHEHGSRSYTGFFSDIFRAVSPCPELQREVAGCEPQAQVLEEIRHALSTNIIEKQDIFSFCDRIYLIVGAGINMTHTEEDFPEDIRIKATSVFMETGLCPERPVLISGFFDRFEQAYALFLKQGITGIVHRWKKLSGIEGKHVSVNLNGLSSEGTVLDLDHDGALIIELSDGSIRRVISGDVSVEG